MVGVTTVTVRLDEVVAAEARRRVEEGKRVRAVLSADDRWYTYRLPREEAARVRAAWRAEVERLRTAGELLDTLDVLAAFGVRAELRARGWDRHWPPLPPEAPAEKGRWPGSRDRCFAGSLTLRLPAGLAAQTRAGCWDVSKGAIAEVRRWRDRSPGTVRDATELALYEQHAASITTPGDIWRAAIRRSLTTARSEPR
ncbi:hypothetical protein [Streptomyces yaizuensis]|uniref:Uncharacterized protein n=1 Tax=Streptomyces yaizuensis TaxID=2989713 RepID=A0ABQ5PBI7_9ACTN|nr:hypothetical protein [Streptomyces sp. YSPA8]GLF99932.1 hypothetical protein SYYSPA8_36565 [Streptomyces sp. YSPA8]